MVARDDLVDFLLGLRVHRPRFRLIVDVRDHIGFDSGVQGTEVILHGMKRNEAAQVQIHVVAVADFLHGADHGEADTIEQDRSAHGRAAGKQRAAYFVADDDDFSLLRIVHRIDPAALVHRQVTNLVEFRRHAHDLAAGLEKVADGSNIAAADDGHGGADAGALAKDVLVIAVGQVILLQGGKAALHLRGASRPDEHDVLAQGVELLAISRPETFSQTDQQEQGTDSPGNAEHGQERAQFMRPEGPESLPDDVEDDAHAGLDYYTGRKSPRFRSAQPM